MKYRFILFVLFLAKSLDIWAYDTEIDGLRYDWVSYNNSSSTGGDVSLVGYSSSLLTEDLTIPCYVKWNERKIGKEGRSCQVCRVEKGAFENCTIIKSVNFSCVMSVMSDAFKNCTSLKTMYFSNTIISILPASFSGCTSLSEIHIDKKTPPNVYEDSFDESTFKNAIVYVPVGCVSAYRNNEIWNKFINISDGSTKNYSLSIKVIGNGAATYDDITIKNDTKTFTVNEGTSATIKFTPDDGNRIKCVKLNSEDVTSNVTTSKLLTINEIAQNMTLEVTFEETPQYTLDLIVSGNGVVKHKNVSFRNKTQQWIGPEGYSLTFQLEPDDGYRVASVKENDKDVTSSIVDNQYTVSNISENKTLKVTFEAIPPITYTLSIKASGNGSATYDGTTIKNKTNTFTVNEGSSATITFSPDNGYRIKSVTVNNSSVSVSNNQYTISSISGNTTVSVEFEAIPPTTYTLSITASGNGSASYDGNTIRGKTSSFTVTEGTSATITFTPDNGYRIKSVKVNNTAVSVSNNQYTISSISANTTVSVEFEVIPPKTYTLSITASGNGSASYDGTTIRSKTSSFTVTEGTSATITFTPDNGYRIKSVKVNNTAVSVSNNQYTISSISGNTTVSVEFEAIPPTTYTLSITASGNGSASYDGTTIRSKTSSFTVTEGTSATITFSPDNGYRIKSVTVNNSSVSVSNNQYTISSISGNTTVSVEFEAIPPTTYTLTITTYGNGSASYDGTTIRSRTSSFTVTEGTSATIYFTPDNGYRIKSVTVNNTDVTYYISNDSYTISSISGDTSVEVEFEEIPSTTYTLSITAYGNGSASYNGTIIRSRTSSFTVTEGSSATIYFTPDNGYRIKSVTVNNTDVTSYISNDSYTISSISGDISVEVDFEEIPPTTYTLSITATGNGSASYNNTTIRSKTTTFTVNEGTNATLTFTPDNGYRIKSVKVNSSTVTVPNNQYTISNIKANTTVSVEFEAIPPTTYTLSITATGNGSASYNNTTIRSKTTTFTVNEGTNATLTFTPDNGYRIKSVKVNNSTVTASNNQYTISNIKANTTVSVEFEAIPATNYTLSITATGNGFASYNNTTIRSKTSTFTVNEGTNATITFTPDNGYRIKSLKLNSSDVTSYVSNNSYTISNITKNSSIEVEFAEELKSFTSGGINYSVSSYDDKTIIVVGGNYGKVLEVPAEITYQDIKWKVIGIDNAALADNTELAAIIWNPAAMFTLNVSNPNLLLYVTSANYAPSSITNVIVNNTANKIVLSDAVSGNDFYCPKDFTAKSISYTHNYLMTTGIGESRGWETIALPFDVQKISHSSKGEIIPFANWKSGDSKKPFWLMTYGTGGWINASSIEANTPYIISMPNHSDYKTEFRLNGNITFSSANVTVKKSDNILTGSYDGKTFIPSYTYTNNDGYYALNVNSDYVTYYGEYSEGSHFISGLRAVRPFEAYMTSSSSAARSIAISGDMATGIENIAILIDESKGIRVYNLNGQLVIAEVGQSLDDVKKKLSAGVYIVNGKKLIIK